MRDSGPQHKERPWWFSGWAIVLWLAGFAAALLAFLNGIPEFVDETLPWLGERVQIGPIDPTVWDVGAGAVAVLAAAAGATTAGVAAAIQQRLLKRGERRSATDGTSIAPDRHTLAAVGGTDITCSCGWRGPGWEFKAHREEQRG